MNLKEYIKNYIRELLDEESSCGDVGAYSTPFAFKKKKLKKEEMPYDEDDDKTDIHPQGTSDWRKKKVNENMKNILTQIVKEELLNEVTYSKFKNEVKYRTKNEQLHKAIREVKRKLMEIDRIVEYTSRMKQELSEGEEGIKYWKATEKNVGRIAELSTQINNKIKNLNQ